MNACRRCGAYFPDDLPTPDTCGYCPPVTCRDCGGQDDRTCSCWVSIENDSPADLKAMFASMNLSVGLPGSTS